MRVQLKIFAILLILSFGSLMLYTSYVMYKEDQDGLNDLTFYKGVISNFYLTTKRSTTGGKYRINIDKKSVALQIKGLDQNIGIFRPNQNYSDFFSNVKIGDTASIYFRSRSPEHFNLDVYQLDINSKNYLQIDEVKHNHSKAIIAIFICGLIISSTSIYVWKQKQSNETNTKSMNASR